MSSHLEASPPPLHRDTPTAVRHAHRCAKIRSPAGINTLGILRPHRHTSGCRCTRVVTTPIFTDLSLARRRKVRPRRHYGRHDRHLGAGQPGRGYRHLSRAEESDRTREVSVFIYWPKATVHRHVSICHIVTATATGDMTIAHTTNVMTNLLLDVFTTDTASATRFASCGGGQGSARGLKAATVMAAGQSRTNGRLVF